VFHAQSSTLGSVLIDQMKKKTLFLTQHASRAALPQKKQHIKTCTTEFQMIITPKKYHYQLLQMQV